MDMVEVLMGQLHLCLERWFAIFGIVHLGGNELRLRDCCRRVRRVVMTPRSFRGHESAYFRSAQDEESGKLTYGRHILECLSGN